MLKYIITMMILAFTLFGSDLEWPNNYEKALQEAEKEHKQVYMLITSESCRWCRKFESTTLEDEQILQRLQSKYVLLHISRDKNPIPKKFLTKRVPRHYFLTPKGEVILTFLGYWNVLDFNSFMDDAEQAYKTKFKGKL